MKENSKKKYPEVVQWFGPLLDALRELGGAAKPNEVVEQIAKKCNLSDSLLEATTNSGTLRFANQVAWARQYLVWEGFLEDNKRGIWSLSPTGKNKHFTEEEAYKIFSKWVKEKTKTRKGNNDTKIDDTNTSNLIEESENTSNFNLKDLSEDVKPEDYIKSVSLLQTLKSLSPSGFEQVCRRLLLAHNFENVVVTGKSHDGGIDGYGTLELNPFVNMKVLFQCKRYKDKSSVSRAEVGDFRNAVMGRAEKGIILTTGNFTEEAKREASREGVITIELINGEKLVTLFESVQLGLNPKTIYEVDIKFFEQFM